MAPRASWRALGGAWLLASKVSGTLGGLRRASLSSYKRFAISHVLAGPHYPPKKKRQTNGKIISAEASLKRN